VRSAAERRGRTAKPFVSVPLNKPQAQEGAEKGSKDRKVSYDAGKEVSATCAPVIARVWCSGPPGVTRATPVPPEMNAIERPCARPIQDWSV
jgi:hypothetical protein